MKKYLKIWCERREYIKVTLADRESNLSLQTTHAGFLLEYDDLGITISHSHQKEMLVLIPWSNILSIQLWGN